MGLAAPSPFKGPRCRPERGAPLSGVDTATQPRTVLGEWSSSRTALPSTASASCPGPGHCLRGGGSPGWCCSVLVPAGHGGPGRPCTAPFLALKKD